MRRLAIVLASASIPDAASAHDAFGDLGPFYATLLHPLADPGQGLILAAAGVLLARQPLATVRPAYSALALAGAATVLLGAVATHSGPGLAVTSLAAAALGIAAVTDVDLGRWPSRDVGPTLRFSAGNGPNPLLAKIAGKLEKPDWLAWLAPENMPGGIAHLTLDDLPGIA